MKRDFEKEYRQYVKNDVPDLWSRIEPQLKEKNIEESKNTEDTTEDIFWGNSILAAKIEKQKERKKPFWMKCVPAAAGILVVLLGVRIYQVVMPENKAGQMISTDEAASEQMEEAADVPREEISPSGEESTRYEETESFEDSVEAPVDNTMAEENASEEMPAEAASEEMSEGERSETADQAVIGCVWIGEEEVLGVATGEIPEFIKKWENKEVLYTRVVAKKETSEKWKKKGYVFEIIFADEEQRKYELFLTERQRSALEEQMEALDENTAYHLRLRIFEEDKKSSKAILW